MPFFDYAEDIVDPVTKNEYTEISFYPNIREARTAETTVRAEEQYRPDKIAFRLYKKDDLGWVLPIANNFDETHKHFITNRKIIYPIADDLETLGII